jgi:hypothetical protein
MRGMLVLRRVSAVLHVIVETPVETPAPLDLGGELLSQLSATSNTSEVGVCITAAVHVLSVEPAHGRTFYLRVQ